MFFSTILYYIGFLPFFLQLVVLACISVLSVYVLYKHKFSRSLIPISYLLIIQVISRGYSLITGYSIKFEKLLIFLIVLVSIIFIVKKMAHWAVYLLIILGLSLRSLAFYFSFYNNISNILMFILAFIILKKLLNIELKLKNFKLWIFLVLGLLSSYLFGVSATFQVILFAEALMLELETDKIHGMLYFLEYMIVGLFFSYCIDVAFTIFWKTIL